MKLRRAMIAGLGLLLAVGCNQPPNPNDEIKGTAPLGPGEVVPSGSYGTGYPGAGPAGYDPNKPAAAAADAAAKPADPAAGATPPVEAAPAAPPAEAAKDEMKKDQGQPAGEAKSPEEKPKALDLASVKLNDEELANVNKLPEADRAAAIEQKICPVASTDTGEAHHLGSMETPIKVELTEGQSAFVCCSGCVETLKGDPEKYLAILGDKAPKPKKD